MAIGDYYIQDGVIAVAKEIHPNYPVEMHLRGINERKESWYINKNSPLFTLSYLLTDDFIDRVKDTKKWSNKRFLTNAVNWAIEREFK